MTMLMNRKLLLVSLFLVSCLIHAIAQTDYYYYKGEKIPLTVNANKVCVSIPKDCDKISERILANVQVLSKIKDADLDIYIISYSDFEKLTSLDSWEEDEKSVIVTSSYYTEQNVEVYATPYLDVRLKGEQDMDLLASYVEKYKLRASWHSSLMPLWYTFAITPESNIGPLDCANALYESGIFAASVPDLASGNSLDQTNIPSITNAGPNASSKIYDLQGHSLISTPARGLYIQNGRKYLVKRTQK